AAPPAFLIPTNANRSASNLFRRRAWCGSYRFYPLPPLLRRVIESLSVEPRPYSKVIPYAQHDADRILRPRFRILLQQDADQLVRFRVETFHSPVETNIDGHAGDDTLPVGAIPKNRLSAEY